MKAGDYVRLNCNLGTALANQWIGIVKVVEPDYIGLEWLESPVDLGSKRPYVTMAHWSVVKLDEDEEVLFILSQLGE